MSRYIDAELIEKHIKREDHYTPDERWRPESEFAALVDNIPTVDVVEVVHGKWIPTGGEVLFLREFRCNRCKSRQLGNTNYCSNCGAKMDGKKVE